MKSDLHTHSKYSDGRSPFESMIQAAEAGGLEYMALTDHIFPGSDTSWIDEAREIVNRRNSSVKILIGAEGVILNTAGEISIDEKLAEKLDIVLVDFGHFTEGIFTAGEISIDEKLAEKLDIVLVDFGHFTEGIFKNPPSVKSEFIDNVFSTLSKVCENPAVDIIAHPLNIGRCETKVDLAEIPDDIYSELAESFSKNRKIFEIMNQMCFWFPEVPVSKLTEDYSRIVSIFKEKEVAFSLGSDAHSCCGVGNLLWSERIVRKTGIEKLLLNPEVFMKKQNHSSLK